MLAAAAARPARPPPLNNLASAEEGVLLCVSHLFCLLFRGWEGVWESMAASHDRGVGRWGEGVIARGRESWRWRGHDQEGGGWKESHHQRVGDSKTDGEFHAGRPAA